MDAERLVMIGGHMSALLFGPVQIVIGLIMMFLIARVALLTSVVIIIVILVVSYFLSKINAKLNQELLKAKDERMKATEEMLDIIRFIKITAIEKFFFNKVNDKRDKEIGLIVKK